MKKLIGTVAVAAMLAGAAFAEGITIGSWNRTLFVVGNAYDTGADSNGVTSWFGQSWGGNGRTGSLAFHGASENAGFDFDVRYNGGVSDTFASLGDNALLWIKPIEQIKLTFAYKNDQNVFRSDACFGTWNWDRIGVTGSDAEEGFIFDSNNKNLSVVVTPIEGLSILAGFNTISITTGGSFEPKALNTWDGKISDDKSNRFVDQLGRTGVIAASYTIADIGTIKASIAGCGKGQNKDGESKDKIKVEAAFELTAIENMYFALGAKLPLGGTYASGNQADPMQINAYARMGFDALTVHALVGTKINAADSKTGDSKADGALGFRVQGGVDYALDNGIGLFADVGYANGIYMSGNSGDNTDCVSFGLGVNKGFSNGSLGVAFEGATNKKNIRTTLKGEDDFAWEIPVKMEVNF